MTKAGTRISDEECIGLVFTRHRGGIRDNGQRMTLELQVTLEEIIKRMPGIRVLSQSGPAIRNGGTWGYESLDVEFAPSTLAEAKGIAAGAHYRCACAYRQKALYTNMFNRCGNAGSRAV
ncbi:hypothetical protein A5719_11125 [Mycolicibacterium peregrinum]|nr:hypothetical protein A5719_11125 [Mycolicibacterium peregrinum]